MRAIYKAPSALLSFPHRGRPGKKENTRELVLSPLPYIVVYRIAGDAVHILRVLHGARNGLNMGFWAYRPGEDVGKVSSKNPKKELGRLIVSVTNFFLGFDSEGKAEREISTEFPVCFVFVTFLMGGGRDNRSSQLYRVQLGALCIKRPLLS